jgi:hypothetical protein
MSVKQQKAIVAKGSVQILVIANHSPEVICHYSVVHGEM